ncbi:MAG TPA: hypothetical protein VEZ17_01815, partial [Chitinophagaceae bacterium]|nr:hypothetical protein [Chitinophagaceae bacterium]
AKDFISVILMPAVAVHAGKVLLFSREPSGISSQLSAEPWKKIAYPQVMRQTRRHFMPAKTLF